MGMSGGMSFVHQQLFTDAAGNTHAGYRVRHWDDATTAAQVSPKYIRTVFSPEIYALGAAQRVQRPQAFGI
ncbi:uncharacterized protein PG998_012573 [Apiospora kogelbergensis]|uniref:Uncharacterized protein n=1 Tax=Apiospora kogelbergensis TaxID=1337665 RepID=A0AAW0QUP7_9PEZI